MPILSELLHQINAFLWNFPMLVLLMGTHIYFTFKLKFIQKWIPQGIRFSFSKSETDSSGIHPYAALATSLAATIGTGNIIGVSTAIAIGGPGAVFWCWISGFLGIATCYAESFLSVKYRIKKTNGQYTGGPMYVLKQALHMKCAAIAFALFAVFASFGIGSSVQANSICLAVREHFSVSPHIIGILIALIAGFVILGGVTQISKICTCLVPFMSLFYLGGCVYLLLANHQFVLKAVSVIIRSAFTSESLIGGITGTSVLIGIRTGISKGLFTNEAGLGSIPITAAASSCKSPNRQGLISMTGPFWDTVVICAITGIVIVSSMLRYPHEYATAASNRFCFIAFSKIPFCGEEILSISLILFAFATIVGWCYYGECSIDYLAGTTGRKLYQLAYILFIYFGSITSLQFVWELSDLLNALMILPNLTALWLLRKEIVTIQSQATLSKICGKCLHS